MKFTFRQPAFRILLFACVVLFCLSSCSKRQIQKTQLPGGTDRKPTRTEKQTRADEFSKPSVIQALSREAEGFFALKNYKDALAVYDRLLSEVKSDKQPDILLKIEAVLARTPTAVIEDRLELTDQHIPKDLLLYYLGLNYALENKPGSSGKALEMFLSGYPQHARVPEAEDLLKTVRQSMFRRDIIGCLLPLTGKYAAFGQKALTGIQMAVQDLSEKFGKSLKTVVFDTQADPGKAVEGVQWLYEKHAAAIIGPLLTEMEAGPKAEELKIPMMALTQKSEFPLLGDYLFANFITPEMQVQALGNYLFGRQGVRKAAVLYPDERYGDRYMRLFCDMVREMEGEVVATESYSDKETDFTRPIQKIISRLLPPDKPEIGQSTNQEFLGGLEDSGPIPPPVLFIPDSPSRAGLILPQLVYFDAKGLYLAGTNLWHHDSYLEGARGYHQITVIADGFFEDSRNPITAAFARNYEVLFKQKPRFMEAVAYDTASILFLTAMDDTVNSREDLKNALKNGRVYDGVTGPTRFDERGVVHRPLFLITVKKGRFAEINH